ncbi:autotransporter outer membrane beta-barrel domain-containing protein [Stenotrophomonas maltophilia]|nr:autotransporter outer membrane beta-barrel domain-containing protein [Stenotrophomonas maltophilia]MCI1087716.1 autotransporter outer membrane beta-barrel domain-containing protein [Stenotrophomonas maltophilia]MCI1116786.1 autotransporter outer membrane beta-barrel domain-containing protein [Stenotrophomonas maltophilia]
MRSQLSNYSALALALAAALAAAIPARVHAQQVIADGDEQTPAAGDYSADGVGNHAFHALNGGSIVPLGPVNVSAGGDGASAARAEGAGSRIALNGSTLVTTGFGATTALATTGGELDLTATDVINKGSGMGVVAHTGSQATLQDVNIRMEGGSSVGLAGGGDITMAGGSISAMGAGSTAVRGTGANLALTGVTIEGNSGIHLADNSRLDLAGSHVTANGIALNVNGRGNAVSVVDTTLISTGNGVGTVVQFSDSTLAMTRSAVVSEGSRAVGIDVRGGTVDLDSVNVTTQGESSHGLYADFSSFGTRPVISTRATQVSTSGDGAIGAVARKGGSIHLVDSIIRTEGREAYGVLAGGNGAMTLTGTDVRTEGEGAWAAVINDNGSLGIDGSSLVSAQHGGVWVRSSRDPGLTLSNNAYVSGGNGIAIALDAAVAGRFDVVVQGGSQMVGDIVITPEDEDAGLVPQSDVHVRLADRSLWQGSSDLVQTMAIESGSQWTLTGDATVGELDVRNSGVALSDGSGRFNTLTVEGDLHSEGATFLFQGALGGDDSAFDRLHVRGDTSGDASIAVKNIGGVGAQTTDGIQLIEVDGASLATYALAGRAVGGSYEYFLFQGGVTDPADGNWYLRSQWFDICKDDPAAPGCVVDPGPDPIEGGEGEDGGGIVDPILPPPVLRPEPGAYLANQSAAINMFAHRLNDRIGAVSLDDGRAAWARVDRQQADFSAVGRQLSVDGNTSVLQIGSDLLRRGNAAFGVMLGNGRADNRVASDLTGYTATGRVRGTAVGVYGTWMQDAEGTRGAYVDATVQFGRFDNRVQGIGLEPEHYDSRVATASLEIGHTFNVWQGAANVLYVQPQLQLTYADYRADRHMEANGTVIDHADAGGLSGRLGVRVFGHGTAAGNTVQPYLGVNWLRGSGTSTLQFNDDTLGADVPRNRYEVQAGAELKLGQRWNAWGGLSVQRGEHGYRNVGGQVGVRMAW